MNLRGRVSGRALVSAVALFAITALSGQPGSRPGITIVYPETGAIFPPEIGAPSFLWRDAAAGPAEWQIEVSFAAGAEPLHVVSPGDPPPPGEIDARAVAATNRPPALGPREAGAHSWQPSPGEWDAIKRRASGSTATLTVRNSRGAGRVTFSVSKDPVGAPIFYRDVPLMPSAAEDGVIKPLPSTAVPLVAWRLRDISQPRSRLLLEGLPTCANCHSFSRDGKTIGIDVDGAENDKGTYAIAAVAPVTSIRTEDVITWNAFPDKPAGHRTIGFMSQLSPDGRYAVSTVNESLYVANFTEYRFLQVFYPTRGILACYDRTAGRIQALPGANDPRYVHTNAVWSPDGKYLVFARAEAKDPVSAGGKRAAFANDPAEVPIQYGLYRIPFNEGKGGTPEPIKGASGNGMSNSFPKISPDGRWIVYVQARNGQLMRPDSQLYIVPAAGGKARRMNCNTPLMNSWHSFSPNGRWLVFSSKSRSPYTQMFLTHVDENGNDSPPVLIENSTAANRAVNIPEFVNIPPDGILRIDVPAAEFYRLFDRARELSEKGQHDAAIEEWRRALRFDPEDAKAHSNLGVDLARAGKIGEALLHLRKAVALRPEFAQAHYNLGGVLLHGGNVAEAIASFRHAVQLVPQFAEAHYQLGVALARQEQPEQAEAELRKSIAQKPAFAPAHNDLGIVLLTQRRLDDAVAQFEQAIAISPGLAEAHYNLAVARLDQHRLDDAAAGFKKALALRPAYSEARYGLGKVSYARNNIREALDHWLEVMPAGTLTLKTAAWVLAVHPDPAIRDGRKAVQLAEQAVRIAGSEAAALDVLAAAYAECARYPEAVKTARQAAALAAQSRKPSLAEAIEARAVMYERGQPYRDTRLP